MKGKKKQEVRYYISSLSPDLPASEFGAGIRGHWQIESMHYIKDVTFGEDASKLRKGHMPGNMSIIRSMLINIFRHHGSHSIAQGIRRVGHNITKMARILLENDLTVMI